jgi:hypothetical protein
MLLHGKRLGVDAEAESSEAQEVGECRALDNYHRTRRKYVDELDAARTHALASAKRGRGSSSLGSVHVLD